MNAIARKTCVSWLSSTQSAMRAPAQRGGIVAMNPPYRYINHYKALTDCIRTMCFGSISGTAVKGGFHIDPDELLRLTQ